MPICHPLDRIGLPHATVDPAKIMAVVETDAPSTRAAGAESMRVRGRPQNAAGASVTLQRPWRTRKEEGAPAAVILTAGAPVCLKALIPGRWKPGETGFRRP